MRSVVELVDHDHVEVIRSEPVQGSSVQGLDAGEEMRPALRDLPTVQETRRSSGHQDVLVGPQGLLQDLFAVGDEE